MFKQFHKLSLLTASLAITLCSFSAQAETHTFDVVGLELSGTKMWLPSSFTVKKGDTVKIRVVSKMGGKNNIHGYAIEAYKIHALVDDKGLVDEKGKHTDQIIEFVADKAGVFRIHCHLHPAHIGGQLTVLE